MSIYRIFFILALFFAIPLAAKEVQDNPVIVDHSLIIGDQVIEYSTVSGLFSPFETDKTPKAKIYYVAYFKKGERAENRPITFCFNGGPGASSAFLQLGGIGPKKAIFDINRPLDPIVIVDNPNSTLEVSDLVFIDPVSTGYSRSEDKDKASNFHDVEKDIETVGEFIRLFLVKNNRFISPKYLMGASYGAYRALGLLSFLEKKRILFDGVILLSPALDLTILDYNATDDLPFVLALPSYTAIAGYHQKTTSTRKEAESFAATHYLTSLFQGTNLTQDKKNQVIKVLSELTALKPSLIKSLDLRIPPLTFAKMLLESQGKIVGRFDGRVIGNAYLNFKPFAEYDPSLAPVLTSLTKAYNSFAKEFLQWKSEEEYRVLANVFPWKGLGKGETTVSYKEDVVKIISMYENFKIFVASGIYDLATPYFSTSYTLSHLNVPLDLRSSIQHHLYKAGHMMYLDENVLIQLQSDIRQFYKSNL